MPFGENAGKARAQLCRAAPAFAGLRLHAFVILAEDGAERQ